MTILSKKLASVNVKIYTNYISKQLKLDVNKFNSQYGNLTLEKFVNSHDRFLIIDDKVVYHIGASLKDLGKKWVAFSRFDKDVFNLSSKLK